MTYRLLPHTADLRVALEAPSFEALLQDVVALVRELAVGSSSVEPRASRDLALERDTPAELLFAFARETLAAFQVDGWVPARFDLARLALPPQATRAALAGTWWGEPFDPGRHQVQPEIKALTRHGLAVESTPAGWRAELLFDV